MSHGSRHVRRGRTRRAAPSRTNRPPSCERLEDRALPSFLASLFPTPRPVAPTPRPSELPPNVSGRVAGLYELSLTSHPLFQSVTDGHVTKAPMFSAAYRGPRSLALDVVGASAHFSPGQGLSLTGQVLGPISGTEPAVYTFLVDRGGAPTPGPIKIRPRIVYDAAVEVKIGAQGQAGSVTLLDPQGEPTSTVDLPAEAVRIHGAAVHVAVPAALLPPTTTARPRSGSSGYRYTFTAGVPGIGADHIAGFAPEYVPAAVSISKGSRPAATPRLLA